MKISKQTLDTIIRETLQKARQVLSEESVDSTGDPDVDRVALYLDVLTEREEMLLAIPLMFKKIMAYEDHNVTVGEFRDLLFDSFADDDANVLFTVLSKSDALGDEEDSDSEGEEPQDKKDKEDERLAAKDRKASDREDDGDKGAQSLADRRKESKGASKREKNESANMRFSENFLKKVVREVLRRNNK